MTSSHQDVYIVEIEERARYTVRVLARTAGEACRKAADHLVQDRTACAPWSIEPLGARVEATLLEKVPREDALR